MEMVIKENGVVRKENIVEKEVATKTNKKKEYNYDPEDMDDAFASIDSIMRSFKNDSDLIKTLYKRIAESKSNYDIIDDCVSEYISMRNYRTQFSRDEHYRKKYSTINKTRDYSNDVFIRKISMFYFDRFVKNLPYDKVEECNTLLRNGTTSMDLFENLDIKFSKNAIAKNMKEYGAAALAFAIRKYYIMRRHHLCFDCKYDFNECPKMAIDWDDISKYSFITNGAQIVKNGKISKFYVYKCALQESMNPEQKILKNNNK